MHDRYDSIEFDAVEYMASSGGLSCPDSDVRIAYMQLSGYPQLEFNGGNTVNGAGTDAINGSVYDPIVRSMLDDATPVALTITDFSFTEGSAFINVAIDLEGDLPAGSNMVLRVAMIEDDLLYSGTTYNNILRDMLRDEPLTISQDGEAQNVSLDIAMDPTWNAANLRAVAFVQDDTDRQVWQSTNTHPTPAYSMRYYATGPKTIVGSGAYSFDTAGLFNTGTSTDVYTVSLDTSNMPAEGTAHFTYNGTDYTETSIALAPGERALFNVVLDTGSATEGGVTLNLHSDSGQVDDRQVEYKIISADTDVLIVDDDGAFDYESLYLAPAVAGTGKSHATWDRNSTELTGPILANFDIVVWATGFAFPTLDASDTAALSAYLDGGGKLFITGQDIGWDLNDQGGAAVLFYRNYLHATYVSDDTNDLTLDGVEGTFTEGLALAISGGDGANNQEYPSDIDPRGEFATEILTYSPGRNGGIAVDTGVYRVVYLSFGFEAINNAADRAALMEGAIGFLTGSTSAVGEAGLPRPIALLGNTPNPFNPQTDIAFRLAGPSVVDLQVFDLRGHLVRRLEKGMYPEGDHRVTWDGRNDQGHEVPSGSYFYVLKGRDETLVNKMMLVR